MSAAEVNPGISAGSSDLDRDIEPTQAPKPDLTSVRTLIREPTKLARAIEMTPKAVYKWQTVNRIPGAHIVKLANYYNVEIRDLLHLTASDIKTIPSIILKERKVLRALLDVYCGKAELEATCAEVGYSVKAAKLALVNWGDDLPTLYSTLEQLDQGRITLEQACDRLKIELSTLHGLRTKYGYAPGRIPPTPKPLKTVEAEYEKVRAAVGIISGELNTIEGQRKISDVVVAQQKDYEARVEAWRQKYAKHPHVREHIKNFDKRKEEREQQAVERNERIQQERVQRREAFLGELSKLPSSKRAAELVKWERKEKEMEQESLVDTGLACSYRTVFRYMSLLTSKGIYELREWPRSLRKAYAKECWDAYDWDYKGKDSAKKPKQYAEKWLKFVKDYGLVIKDPIRFPETPKTWRGAHINRCLIGLLLTEASFEEICVSRGTEPIFLESLCNGQLQVLGISFKEAMQVGATHQIALAEIFNAMDSRKREPVVEEVTLESRAALVQKALEDASPDVD